MARIKCADSLSDKLFITSIVLLLYNVNSSSPGLEYPDFESKWLQISAQSNSSSYLEVQHGLGQVPALVDVLVKSQSQPNKGFIFKGIGTGVRDDDEPYEYGSVVYIYNENTVRLFAPNMVNGYASGYTIYTGEQPYFKGVNSQKSRDALVKIRCWTAHSLPATCYEASNLNFVVGSNDIDETYKELKHNLVQRPDILIVRALLLDYSENGWYMDGQGCNPVLRLSPGNPVKSKTSGFVYGFDNESVRIWAPSDDQKLFKSRDGWGDTANQGQSGEGLMEVRAWCSLPNLFTTTIPVGPDVSSESLEILFDLPEAETDHDDIFVGVKVQPQDGANAWYLFDGIGGAFETSVNLSIPCIYGGVVYGYSESGVRLWLPDDAKGAALCIGDDMGHGTNSQASNTVNIILTVWRLGYISTTTVTSALSTTPALSDTSTSTTSSTFHTTSSSPPTTTPASTTSSTFAASSTTAAVSDTSTATTSSTLHTTLPSPTTTTPASTTASTLAASSTTSTVSEPPAATTSSTLHTTLSSSTTTTPASTTSSTLAASSTASTVSEPPTATTSSTLHTIFSSPPTTAPASTTIPSFSVSTTATSSIASASLTTTGSTLTADNTFETCSVVQDCCIHFQRLAEDAKPASSPYRTEIVLGSANVFNCYHVCIRDVICIAFVWNLNNCELFDTGIFQTLVQNTGSEVWAILQS